MQQGQAAPGAAHRVEGVGGKAVDPGQALLRLLIDRRRVEGAAQAQGEGSQRQGDAPAGPAMVQAHQLQAGAAQVAGHAVGARRPGDHAHGGQAGFLVAGDDVQLKIGLGLDPGDEGAPVRGLAHGGGGGRIDRLRPDRVEHRAKPAQGRQGRFHAGGRQGAGAADIAAEARLDLLVEQAPDGPSLDPIDHQAHGVGADVQHGHVERRGAGRVALAQGLRHGVGIDRGQAGGF